MKTLHKGQILYLFMTGLCGALFLFWILNGLWAAFGCLIMLAVELVNRHDNIRQSFVHITWFAVSALSAQALLMFWDVAEIEPGMQIVFFFALYVLSVILTLSFSKAPLRFWPKSHPLLENKIQAFFNLDETQDQEYQFSIITRHHRLVPFYHNYRQKDLAAYIESTNAWRQWPDEWYKTQTVTFQKKPMSAHQKMRAAELLTA